MDPYYFLDIELEENEDDISPDGNWIINPDNDYKILYKDKNIHVYFIIRTRSSTYSTQYGHLGLFRIGGYFLSSIPPWLIGVHPPLPFPLHVNGHELQLYSHISSRSCFP